MVSDKIRTEAWKMYVRISAICRYTEDHSNKYRAINRWGLIFLGGLGILATMPEIWPEIGGIETSFVPGILVSIGAFAKLLFGVSDKAGALFKIYMQCSEVRNTYQRLWLEIETGNVTDKEVLDMIEELSKVIDDSTALIGYSDIIIGKGLWQKAHKKTGEILSAEYNSQPVNA